MKIYDAESVPWDYLIDPMDFERAQQNGLLTVSESVDLFEVLRTGLLNNCHLNTPKSRHHGTAINPVTIQVRDITGELQMEYIRYETQVPARTVKSIITKQLNGNLK